MTSIEDKVNSILNGSSEPAKTEWHDPQPLYPVYKPLAFGELPKDIGIPMDKSHRIPIIEEKDGKIILCGKEYSDKNRTEKGWEFHDAVDVMSWAYSSGFKFRPEVWGNTRQRRSADAEDISKVEVYVKKSDEMMDEVTVKKGTGLKFRFSPDGKLDSMSYGKNYDTRWCYKPMEYAYIHKGSIIWCTADGYGDFDDCFDYETIGYW